MSGSQMINNSASRFKQRIKLERPILSQDSIGDTLTTWVVEAEIWADIKSRSANEIFRHESLSQTITHDISIRYRECVQPNWRVIYRDRILHIHAVIIVDEADKILLLKAEEN